MSFRKDGYKERLETQTINWLNGKPEHNKIDDECCPDFSCCTPELLASKEERQKFYNAHISGDTKTINKMLGDFLGWMLARNIPMKDIHIIG